MRLERITIIAIFAMASILSINPYHYGVSDQVITVPFLKHWIDPHLYSTDYITPQIPYYYTYLWPILALTVKYLHVPIPILFFCGYALALILFLSAIYSLSVHLFNDSQVAHLAMFMLLFGGPALGGVNTFDVLYTTRMMAIPVALFAIHFFLKQKYTLSFFLQGVCFLIHPLTGVYIISALAICALRFCRRIGIAHVLLCFIVLIAVASPILLWRVLSHPSSGGMFHVDRKFIELMRLRNEAHVFPFSWNKSLFLRAGIILSLFFVSWQERPDGWNHAVIRWMTWVLMGLCVIGTVFVEVWPLFIVIQLQLFRGFCFVLYIAFIYIAHLLLVKFALPGRYLYKFILLAICASVFYLTSHGLAGYAGIVAVLIVQNMISNLNHDAGRYVTGTIVIVVIVLMVVYRHNFYVRNVQLRDWRMTQIWARESTKVDDEFIVPPRWMGFRVDSERAIYGDWKDGTQMFFNVKFGYKWMDRMLSLGYDKNMEIFARNYSRLSQAALLRIAAEIDGSGRSVYYIVVIKRNELHFPLAYHNKKFYVYKIS